MYFKEANDSFYFCAYIESCKLGLVNLKTGKRFDGQLAAALPGPNDSKDFVEVEAVLTLTSK